MRHFGTKIKVARKSHVEKDENKVADLMISWQCSLLHI